MNTKRIVNANLAVALFYVTASVMAADPAAGKPFLHPLFTDHMVLQRDVATAVWGWTQPGMEVKVALAGKTVVGVDARISP